MSIRRLCLVKSGILTGDFLANWDPHWSTFGVVCRLRKVLYVDNILIRYLVPVPTIYVQLIAMLQK